MATKIAPILITILLAGAAGFAVGRSMNGLEAAVAASGAVQVEAERSGGTGPDGCRASASQTATFGETPVTISAFAEGPTCPSSIAVITLRDPAGALVWVQAYPTEHVFGLADAGDSHTALADALAEWIAPPDTMQTTASLPEWRPGTDGPGTGEEFPFLPEDWLDQQSYSELRAEAAPLYCYVQGMESMNCLALRDGRLESVGVQLFPG